MTSNNRCIAGQLFTQIDGATIGRPDSASIMDMFGGQFIDPVAERGMKTNAGEILKPLDWRRYRDAKGLLHTSMRKYVKEKLFSNQIVTRTSWCFWTPESILEVVF